jgi:hypothetical protein
MSTLVAAIFERPRTSAEASEARLKMLRVGRMFYRGFAASRATLRAMAERIGVQRLANVVGSSAC